MKILAFVYARMNSSRLPGKVLMKLGNDTTLGIIVKKLQKLGLQTVVLTSDEVSDDELERWCNSEGVACFRGSLLNLAERTVYAIEKFKCDYFFRVNGDSPFIRPELFKEAIATLMDSEQEPDIVSNIIQRNFPYGIAVELVNASNFVRKAKNFTLEQREHITSYLYANTTAAKAVSLNNSTDQSSFRFVLDTEQDYNNIQAMIALEPDVFNLSVDRLIRLQQQIR